MQQLTPQQNANTQKNVQSLLDSRANSVKVPTTKGTFHNTENGWVNTTAGGWKANPKLENYSIFSVKWGPAIHAFTDQGETEQSIKGKSHLYMYFGVDRLRSRNFSQTTVEAYTNESFKLNGLHIDHIYFSDPYHWGYDVSKWVMELTPTMYEVNYRMNGSQADASGKYLANPKAASTYYTGWVETPWSTYMNEPMYAVFFASTEIYQSASNAKTGVSLVLFRGNPSVLRSIGDAFPQNSKVAYSDEYDATSTLNDVQVFLSYPVSNPVTIFDEIPSELSSMSNGIAQSHAGGLAIEESRLYSPNLALRERTYTYNLKWWFVPSFSLPQQGMTYIRKDGYIYIFEDSLNWRGQKIALKCKELSGADNANILAGKFNWATPTDELLFGVNMTILNEYGVRIYLNSCKLGGNTPNLVPRAIDVCARVLFDKPLRMHYLQFWGMRDIENNPTQAPDIPANCTPVSDWFHWCTLEFPIDNTTTLLMNPTDSVVGRLDSSDTLPDSWYALSAGLSKQFLSLDHTTELSGAGQGSTAGGKAKALELYKFNDLSYSKETLSEDDQYLIRHPDGDGGAVLQYGPLSAIQSNVDTRMPLSVDQNSIDYADLSGDTYLQFYKFPDNERIETKTALSDVTDVVLRHRYNKTEGEITQQIVEVDYLSADEVINPIPDAEANGSTLYSLSKNGKSQASGKEKWELYNFHDQDYQNSLGDLTQGCSQFVVRNQWEDMNTTAKVRYVPVDQVVAIPDSQEFTSKSIELNSENTSKRELRLYNFLSANEAYSNMSSKPTFKDLAEDGYSILIRDDDDGVGPQLKYFDLRYLSRYGDADLPGFNQSSIETGSSSNTLSAPYFQLADFPSPSVADINFTIKYDGKAYHMTNNLSTAEDVQFVMRNALGGSKDVEYYDFTITAPKVGMTALTEEVINELTSHDYDGPIGDLSNDIIDISAQLSSLPYWESGGDSSTCYGSDIGDSNGNTVINLNAKLLDGSWQTNGDHGVAGDFTVNGDASIGGNESVTGDLTVGGTASIASLNVGSWATIGTDINVVGSVNVGCGVVAGTSFFGDGLLVLGNTSLTEAQLIQLLRLV